MKVGSRELAEMLGLSVQRVNQLAKEKIITKEGRSFDLFVVISEYIQYKGATDETINFNYQRARLEKLKADRVELEILERRQILVPHDMLNQAVIKLLTEVKATLRGIPQRVSGKLKRAKTEAQIKSVLNLEINKALNVIATDKLLSVKDLG